MSLRLPVSDEFSSLRRHFLVLLRDVVTEAIDVVLEDKVVNLAGITRLCSRDTAILEARALQV